MKTLYFAHWHKPTKITANNGTLFSYPANSLSLISYPSDNLLSILQSKGATVHSANELAKPWHITERKPRRLVCFMVKYGIGDHIAFSAVAKYIEDHFGIEIAMYTTPEEFHIYDHFQAQNITLYDATKPISNNFNLAARFHWANFRRLYMEYAAIEGRERNWYECMFARIGLHNPPPEYCRPALIKHENEVIPGSILINHSASCQIRTSRLQDFWEPVKMAFPGKQIYVNDYDLSKSDREYIAAGLPNTTIVRTLDASEYLENLAKYELVISTDSAAPHYREGIGLPTIAVYSAFTPESRIKYYKHTDGVQIKGTCPLSPCFAHGSYCTNHQNLNYAVCQSFESFQEQLYNYLSTYQTPESKQQTNIWISN